MQPPLPCFLSHWCTSALGLTPSPAFRQCYHRQMAASVERRHRKGGPITYNCSSRFLEPRPSHLHSRVEQDVAEPICIITNVHLFIRCCGVYIFSESRYRTHRSMVGDSKTMTLHPEGDAIDLQPRCEHMRPFYCRDSNSRESFTFSFSHTHIHFLIDTVLCECLVTTVCVSSAHSLIEFPREDGKNEPFPWSFEKRIQCLCVCFHLGLNSMFQKTKILISMPSLYF